MNPGSDPGPVEREAFEHEVHVRYAETDQMGVVYHANYLVYLEEGRTRMMAALGHPYHLLEREGVALVVRKADLRYRASARYGDRLLVRTRPTRVRGASITYAYDVRRAEGDLLLATATTELACVDLNDPARRPRMLPDGIRDALLALLPPD